MKKIALSLIFIFYSAICNAGTETGNGGDIVVCNDVQSEHHLKILDVYEAERYGMWPKWAAGKNWKEIAKNQFLRWMKIAPKRIETYLGWLEEFEGETSFTDNITIPDIPDHGSVVLPKGCRSEQVALQRHDDIIFPGVKRYEIDNKYWINMKPEQRAALVMHELVYREAIDTGHKNSIPTRYFTGFLIGGKLDPLVYLKIVVQLPFEYAEFYNTLIDNGSYRCGWGGCHWIDQVTLNENGYPIKVYLELLDQKNYTLEVPGVRCNFDSPPEFSPTIGYDKNGNINVLALSHCNSQNFFAKVWGVDKKRSWDATANIKSLTSSIIISENSGIYERYNLRNVKLTSSSGNLLVYRDNYFSGHQQLFIKKFGWIIAGNDNRMHGKLILNLSKESHITIDGKMFKSLGKYRYESYLDEYVTSFQANDTWWIFDEQKDQWVEKK